MKIGFDLDGTLDRPHIAELCRVLLAGSHEVHIITGVFPEALGWQDHKAHLHVLTAMPSTYDRAYRLTDLGLRKGALCEELGITLFLDDSALYCEMIPKMSGNTL